MLIAVGDLFHHATEIDVVLRETVSVSVEVLQHVVLSKLLDKGEFTSREWNQPLTDKNQAVEIIVGLGHPKVLCKCSFKDVARTTYSLICA